MNDQQRAAMRCALEALEEAHTVIEHRQDVRKREEAITALREALAQPQGEWVDLTDDEIKSALTNWFSEPMYWAVQDAKSAIAKFKEKNTPKVVPQEPVLNLHDAAFARGFAAGKQYGQAQVDALVANVSRQMRDAAVKVCSEWKREETLDMCCDYAQNEALTKASEAIAALPIIGETK